MLIPTIEGLTADKWWSKYRREMRKVFGEKWMSVVLDALPPDERDEAGALLLKALQLAQIAYMERNRPGCMESPRLSAFAGPDPVPWERRGLSTTHELGWSS